MIVWTHIVIWFENHLKLDFTLRWWVVWLVVRFILNM